MLANLGVQLVQEAFSLEDSKVQTMCNSALRAAFRPHGAHRF
jgi:hypothetical protein